MKIIWSQSISKLMSAIALQSVMFFASVPANASDWTLITGLDNWQLHPSVEKDSAPGYSEENTNLLLPNASAKWNYKNHSPFLTVSGQQDIYPSFSIHLKARADQVFGVRVDEADIEHNISPQLGIRAGVVNYKISWCKDYDRDNGWMRDIEAICVTPAFKDATGSAPGMQIFTNSVVDHYRFQTQLGVYHPRSLNYAPQEFGNVIPSPNYQVTQNKKIGVNFNALNLRTGIEARLSYMQAQQAAYLPESNLQGIAQQNAKIWYWGVSAPLTPKLTLRATELRQTDTETCVSDVAQIASSCNLDQILKKRSTALQLSYQLHSNDLLSIGVSRTKFDVDASFYNAQKTQYIDPPAFFIHTRQKSLAWRHDWSSGLFTVVQGIWSSQNNGYPNGGPDSVQASSHGYAFGLRVAYIY